MPPFLQGVGSNLLQFTLPERSEAVALPEFRVSKRDLVCLTHQHLIRNLLMELTEHVGATSVEVGVGLHKKLLKFRGALVDVHHIRSIFSRLVVAHLLFGCAAS